MFHDLEEERDYKCIAFSQAVVYFERVTRSEAISQALARELKRRQPTIDECLELRSVSFTVKLDKQGSARGIEYTAQEHREL